MTKFFFTFADKNSEKVTYLYPQRENPYEMFLSIILSNTPVGLSATRELKYQCDHIYFNYFA